MKSSALPSPSSAAREGAIGSQTALSSHSLSGPSAGSPGWQSADHSCSAAAPYSRSSDLVPRQVGLSTPPCSLRSSPAQHASQTAKHALWPRVLCGLAEPLLCPPHPGLHASLQPLPELSTNKRDGAKLRTQKACASLHRGAGACGGFLLSLVPVSQRPAAQTAVCRPPPNVGPADSRVRACPAHAQPFVQPGTSE